jgi:uncharacterized membrane protein
MNNSQHTAYKISGMNSNEHINKMIEEALQSVDNVERAAPKPFLLTRIHARMNWETASVWEETIRFITRPAVAFTGLCILVLINITVILSNKASNEVAPADQVVQSSTDEFSYTVATIYDYENTQP